MTKKNILITGGCGFIGSHVAKYIPDNFNTIILDDLSGGFTENLPSGVEFIKGSIEDNNLLEGLFSKYKFKYVYHLAAYAAEGLSHFIRRFNYSNNLIGSVNLINQSVLHEVECFVFTSSIAVYGKGQLPMSEDMTPQPEDPYGIAKLAVELDLKTAKEQFGLNSIIFRPHNVYGENQNIGDKYRNVIGIFMNQIMSDQPLTVFGDGNQTRAFSYIGDMAPLIAKSVKNQEAYNEIFNVGADVPYTINELIEVVATAFEVKPEITYLPERNEVTHAHSSHSKIKKFFVENNNTSLEEGILLMSNWAKKVGVRDTTNFNNIEILKSLPSIWNNK